MISGVHHVGFSTPDIERLIAFYRDVVGFEIALRIEHGTPSGQLDKMVEMDGVTSRMAMVVSGAKMRPSPMPPMVNGTKKMAGSESGRAMSTTNPMANA